MIKLLILFLFLKVLMTVKTKNGFPGSAMELQLLLPEDTTKQLFFIPVIENGLRRHAGGKQGKPWIYLLVKMMAKHGS